MEELVRDVAECQAKSIHLENRLRVLEKLLIEGNGQPPVLGTLMVIKAQIVALEASQNNERSSHNTQEQSADEIKKIRIQGYISAVVAIIAGLATIVAAYVAVR